MNIRNKKGKEIFSNVADRRLKVPEARVRAGQPFAREMFEEFEFIRIRVEWAP